MERLRPRKASPTAAGPWGRQRRWKQRMAQDPDLVIDHTIAIIRKIEHCLDVIATTRNQDRFHATRQKLRRFQAIFKDIVDANILQTSLIETHLQNYERMCFAHCHF